MFEILKEKYPLSADYFENLLNVDRIPNSIILHGPDVFLQYCSAILLARGANCFENKKFDCTCKNCRWISSNEHPEIMTISKINSKPDGDETKSVISVKQIDAIKDKLMSASDYHRFFIFCDAEDKIPSDDEKIKFDNLKNFNIKPPTGTKNIWIPSGLTNKCFTDIVANALLKSIEEPPSNVTFIFLTENPNNIISTIVSRSQLFYIPGTSIQNYDWNFLTEALSNYPKISKDKAIPISDFFLKYSKDNDKSLLYILKSVQQFLLNILKNNSKNIKLKQKILSDIEQIENIIIMNRAGVKNQVIADEAGYILTN